MAEQYALDEETVLRLVQALPREQQIHLAHRVLASSQGTSAEQAGQPFVSSAELRGVGSGGLPAPTDEEIEQWRLEKYEG